MITLEINSIRTKRLILVNKRAKPRDLNSQSNTLFPIVVFEAQSRRIGIYAYRCISHFVSKELGPQGEKIGIPSCVVREVEKSSSSISEFRARNILCKPSPIPKVCYIKWQIKIQINIFIL